MRLYGAPYSAFCAKVRVALRLKGLPFEEVPPPGGYGSDDFRAIAPAGTIPALDIGGRVLFESNAIVEYLDETAPAPRLVPEEPDVRALARAIAGYHDTRVEAVIRPLFPHIGPADPERAPFDQAARLLSERLARLAEIVQPSPYLAGDAVTIADIGFPCTLAMGERLLAEGGVILRLPHGFEDWRARLAGIPAVAETLSEMNEGLESWIEGKHRAVQG